MKRIREYVQECYNELMYKVSWPTWNELQGSSVIVMIASAIIAMLVFGMDFAFNNLMDIFYKTF